MTGRAEDGGEHEMMGKIQDEEEPTKERNEATVIYLQVFLVLIDVVQL